jgi:hypothetical protein
MLRSQHLNELHSVRLITLQLFSVVCELTNQPTNKLSLINARHAPAASNICTRGVCYTRGYPRGDFVAHSVGCELTFEAVGEARARVKYQAERHHFSLCPNCDVLFMTNHYTVTRLNEIRATHSK